MRALTLFNKNWLDDFFDDMDNFWGTNYNHSPKTDVIENKDNYELKVEVPGFNEKDLNIEVKNGYLTISGEVEKENKKEDSKEENNKYIMKERYSSKFSRTFRLPENVNPDNIDAKLKNGVLNISLNKKEEEKPKLIKIS